MPSAAFFEDALANYIGGLAAVQAIKANLPVRIMKLAQKDSLPAIIIGPDTETHENDLSYTSGAISWKGKIRAVSKVFSDCRLLIEAIRTNNTTPGTGLAGYTGTMDGWAVQGAKLDQLDFDFIWYEDGTDEGDFVIDAECAVEFVRAI